MVCDISESWICDWLSCLDPHLMVLAMSFSLMGNAPGSVGTTPGTANTTDTAGTPFASRIASCIL